MTPARFAVPGDLAAPTGGYGYARRILAGAAGRLVHVALPGDWADPDTATLAEAARRIAGPGPVLVDGLALGAIPPDLLGPHIVALCHHPLGLETGLDPARATRLVASERAALAAVGLVVTTSQTTARLLAADFGVAPDRIRVAPPGTDPAPRAVGSGGCHILSVGSLVPRKGHDVLIAALAGVPGAWTCTILGAADRDPGCAAALGAQIATLGLGDRVRLGGAVAPQALAAAYHGADVFALASHYEGYGMVFAEAMARGLPVIGCDGGAVAEATAGAALLVPPGDVTALRAALTQVVGDPAARADLAARAWAAAATLPRWDQTTATILAALAAVAS